MQPISELRDWLLALGAEERQRALGALTRGERARLEAQWEVWARPEQLPPPGEWPVWLICAGRGFGKTRAGAEWVSREARRDGSARIALVGASLHEARSVMVEGESGILAVMRRHGGAQAVRFEPSLRRLTWPNGAQATLFSAAEPESLRGAQHSLAWGDEIGKWEMAGDRATQCWDNLMLGLRLGERPRALVTTTPRNVPLVRRLVAETEAGAAVMTRGRTYDNAANLPPRFLDAIRRRYDGSTLGRQELEGELLEERQGALWSRALIEACRAAPPAEGCTRVVVAVDPPASAEGDECGIVVAGLAASGEAHVLADASLAKASPERWARAVAATAAAWEADRVVAEANQGGAMVASVLRAADAALPLRLVHASRGKAARAEPVAALYEAGKVRHAGLFPLLEDQLCALMPGGTYCGPGRSPDRADALVWALTDLLLGRRGDPQVRRI